MCRGLPVEGVSGEACVALESHEKNRARIDVDRPVRIERKSLHVDFRVGEGQVGHQHLLQDLHHEVQLVMLLIEPFERAERQIGPAMNVRVLRVQPHHQPVHRALFRSCRSDSVSTNVINRFRLPLVIPVTDDGFEELRRLFNDGEAGVRGFSQSQPLRC